MGSAGVPLRCRTVLSSTTQFRIVASVFGGKQNLFTIIHPHRGVSKPIVANLSKSKFYIVREKHPQCVDRHAKDKILNHDFRIPIRIFLFLVDVQPWSSTNSPI